MASEECIAVEQPANGTLATGPLRARRKSQDSSGNDAHMPVTLSVPVYCHPSPGVEKSWPKVGEGRSPVATSSHCGATNPQSKSMSRAVTTPSKREPRLRSCSAQTMVAATSGCRFCTVFKQSLQLARLVAARIHLALRTPTQGQQGKLAMSHVSSSRASPGKTQRAGARNHHAVLRGPGASNQKLALAEAPNSSSNHAACESPTAGILSKRFLWEAIFDCK